MTFYDTEIVVLIRHPFVVYFGYLGAGSCYYSSMIIFLKGHSHKILFSQNIQIWQWCIYVVSCKLNYAYVHDVNWVTFRFYLIQYNWYNKCKWGLWWSNLSCNNKDIKHIDPLWPAYWIYFFTVLLAKWSTFYLAWQHVGPDRLWHAHAEKILKMLSNVKTCFPLHCESLHCPVSLLPSTRLLPHTQTLMT